MATDNFRARPYYRLKAKTAPDDMNMVWNVLLEDGSIIGMQTIRPPIVATSTSPVREGPFAVGPGPGTGCP